MAVLYFVVRRFPSVSDFNPVDVTAAVGQVTPENYSEDPDQFPREDSAVEPDPRPADVLPREREGLPTTFRMRADEHYVDQLTRGVDPDPVIEESRGEDEGSDAGPSADGQALELLADEVAAIESSATLLTDQSSDLSRRVAADLIRAQARRAAWLLGARSLLDGSSDYDPRSQPVGSLLARVRDGLAAEGRLAGVTVQAHAADWQASVAVDDELVVAGLTGAVLATMGLVGQASGAVIRMTAITMGGDLKTIEVRQDAVAVGSQARRRFFDADWTDRPGGALSAIAAEACAAAVRKHGGDAVFTARDRRGSTVRLNFARRS
jgi:hypothetical protein